MKLFVNSDAHRLSDIPEPQNELELPECSAEALIDYIKTVKEFKCCFLPNLIIILSITRK